MGVEVAADVARARPGPAGCRRARPSARRGPRAAPARCRRSRGARRPPPRSRRAHLAALGLGDPVLGDREAACRPRPRAAATLWACEPVKCCSRLPKASGATIRRSTEIPLWVWARAPAVGRRCRRRRSAGARRVPGERRRLLGGGDQVDVLAGLGPAPQPSRRPRPRSRPGAREARRPAPRRSAGPWRAAARPGPLPARRGAPSAASTFSSTFGPRPLSVADPLLLGRLLQVLERRRRRARRRGGARFSRPGRGPASPRSASAGTSPSASRPRGSRRSSSRASIFSASVLPTPGISVARPARGQLGDRDRALADRLRGGAVGEHPVFDRAVELVEDAQLVERGGDLGVGHAQVTRAHSRPD